MGATLDEIRNKIETEYESSRKGSQQRIWAETLMCQIRECEASHAEFRLRRKLFKRFAEEALPIARFVGEVPEFQNVDIILRKGSQPFDAEMYSASGTEYIEVVNCIDGRAFNYFMKQLNDATGMAVGTSGSTGISRILSDIEKKIGHGYSGAYYLLACLDFDSDLFDIEILKQKISEKVQGQRTFKAIYIYERRDKKVYKIV